MIGVGCCYVFFKLRMGEGYNSDSAKIVGFGMHVQSHKLTRVLNNPVNCDYVFVVPASPDRIIARKNDKRKKTITIVRCIYI